MSYIIHSGQPVAFTFEHQPAGQVQLAFCRTVSGELVNMMTAQVSNAKKWEEWESRYCRTIPAACLMGQDKLYREFYAGE